MVIKFSCLREKDVINVCDGRRLGCVMDLDICLPDGKIEAIIVPCQTKLFNFFKPLKSYVIPWCMIKKIGDDVILVELDVHFFRKYED